MRQLHVPVVLNSSRVGKHNRFTNSPPFVALQSLLPPGLSTAVAFSGLSTVPNSSGKDSQKNKCEANLQQSPHLQSYDT